MKKSEAATYEQAFDELEKEGFFKDLSAKIRHLRFSDKTEPNLSSSPSMRQRRTHHKNKSYSTHAYHGSSPIVYTGIRPDSPSKELIKRIEANKRLIALLRKKRRRIRDKETNILTDE